MKDPHPKDISDVLTKQDLDLIPFDTTFCDLKTKCIFETWATIPCIRILAFVQSRKGKPIFSIRGIAIICHLPKTTVSRTLKILVSEKYLIKKGNRYYPNNEIEVFHPRDRGVPRAGQSVPFGAKSVPRAGRNNQLITKRITNNLSLNLTEEEYKEKLKRLGLKERELKQ